MKKPPFKKPAKEWRDRFVGDGSEFGPIEPGAKSFDEIMSEPDEEIEAEAEEEAKAKQKRREQAEQEKLDKRKPEE